MKTHSYKSRKNVLKKMINGCCRVNSELDKLARVLWTLGSVGSASNGARVTPLFTEVSGVTMTKGQPHPSPSLFALNSDSFRCGYFIWPPEWKNKHLVVRWSYTI